MDFNNLNAVLKKTDKGIEALKVRDASLPQKSRVLLILIDGKKTLGDLSPVLTIGSDSLERVKELFNSGYVAEMLQDQTEAKQSQTEQSLSLTTKTDAVNLQTAIRSATKMLSDMLGPNSDVLCMQLEKCKTKDEYNTKILAFRKIIGTVRSEKAGDEFVKAAIL